MKSIARKLFILLVIHGYTIHMIGQGSPDEIQRPSGAIDSLVVDSTQSRLIMSSDEAVYTYDEDGTEIDTLKQNVILVQDSVLMSCDRAIVVNQINATATGNVVIVQNDSIHIYADTLLYNGLFRIANLKGEVILDNGGRQLNTTDLMYDIEKRLAYFYKGGTLLDNESTLISRAGEYDVRRGLALFKYNVQYQDTSRTIYTDSLIYDYQKRQIRIIAPTRIVQNDGTEIYSEAGIYSTENDQGVLSQNVQVKQEDRLITAGILEYNGADSNYRLYLDPKITDEDGVAAGDTIVYRSDIDLIEIRSNATYASAERNISSDIIYYNNRTGTYETKGRSVVNSKSSLLKANEIKNLDDGVTLASGNVILKDTTNHSTIICDGIKSIDSTNISYAYNVSAGQPLLIYELSSADTLLLLGDTLVSQKMDSSDLFWAYHDIKLQKQNITGIADSLSFNSTDSVFVLYNDPILWSDSTQLSADTIKIYMSNNSIDKVDLIDNAFIIEQVDNEIFNQIGGKLISCRFKEEAISEAEVKGNAQMIFHIYDDDDELVGINQAFSGTMRFTFEENEIEEVRFYKNPEYDTFEYTQGMDLSEFRLNGFNWLIDKRPKNSIFVPKRLNLLTQL